MELVMRLQLKDGANRDVVASWLSQVLAQVGAVKESTVLTPEEDEEEERLKGLIHVEGLPDLVETTRLYVRLSPELRLQVGKQAYSLMKLFLEGGVQRTKTILERLRAADPEVWSTTSIGVVRAAYSNLAAELAHTAYPLIVGRRGIYGFQAQAAVTKRGRRTMKRWKPEEEI